VKNGVDKCEKLKMERDEGCQLQARVESAAGRVMQLNLNPGKDEKKPGSN